MPFGIELGRHPVMTKNRRLTILAAACGLLMMSGAPAIATPSAKHAGHSKPRAGHSKPRAGHLSVHTSPVRIVTYNTKYGRSPTSVVADLQRLSAAQADVIGLQEMGSRTLRETVRAQFVECSTCTYDAVMPDTPEQNATPILYKRSKFDLLSTGTRKVSNTTYVGPSGAGPSTMKAKFVNWVQLRHRIKGQVMYVLNSHAVPSVQAGGGGRDTNHSARLRLYGQHMSGLKSVVTELGTSGAMIFSTGDFNVNYRRDSVVRDPLFPYYNMNQVNVHASYDYLGMPLTGTHSLGRGNDTRLIDYVYSLAHVAVTAKSQEILQGYGSDHRPVLVRYAIRGLEPRAGG